MKTCIGVILLALAASHVGAAPVEFSFVSFPHGQIVWVDKNGKQNETDKPGSDASLFSELSGEKAKPTDPQVAELLVLNGLSKAGWTIVHVDGIAGDHAYLLERTNDAPPAPQPAPAVAASDSEKVPLTFTGGYDTDPRDGGRPVVLIAAALEVPDEVFRETFTHVHPARGGPPDPEDVRKNKAALLEGLGKYGVTNDRLDTVSNYYRFNGSRGETWRHKPAEGFAIIRDGKVVGVLLTTAGAGYSSPPTVSIESMPKVKFSVVLSYGKDLATNGAIKQISVEKPEKP